MLRHAASFAASGWDVDVVGLEGRELPAPLACNRSIGVHRIDALERHRAAGAGGAIVRQAGLALLLAGRLVGLARPDLVLVQNPPALPALAALALPALARRWPLWLDWHNTTAAMVGARLGRSAASDIAEVVERALVRLATGHLAVSEALAGVLAARGIRARVLRDTPASAIAPRPRAGGSDELRLVAPMSWGPDDDPRLLLDALERLDAMSEPRPRRIDVVITGDGPGRSAFEEELGRRRFRRATVSTRWVEADGYVAYLAGADAGLSLHRSTSGLDLPMKWADLAEAGVPLLALDYGPVTREALASRPSTRLFTTAAKLAERLDELSAASDGDLEAWRAQAVGEAGALPRWDRSWREALGEAIASPRRGSEA